MAPDQQPDDWADDLASLYIMEEIPPPPITRPARIPLSDLENLALLESFFLPLDPQEAAERLRASTGSGILTRDMIIRALGGEPPEGS